MSDAIDSAPSAADVLTRGREALARGEVRVAIEIYESFADSGGLHPDVSYDRGVAYVTRLRLGEDKPGDLGRAAAAFEETLLLRPGDEGAERAVEAVRAEVARRRVRAGSTAEVAENPTALRAVVGLAPEQVWATGTLVASVVLSVALVLRHARGPARLAGGIGLALGGAALVLFAPLTFAASRIRLTTGTGVVVTQEARLVDERGIPTSQPALPEAARVDVLDRKGPLVRVRWGTTEGYTSAASVRVIARP